MVIGINVQDKLVTETARNDALELYPDSIQFDTMSVWSTGPTKDDDLIHVYIGMRDNTGRAEKLMELAFYKEDLEDERIINGIYAGLEKFKKTHEDTLAVLSNYWKEQKREEFILKEREKAGTIPVDKDGKPINELDRELINNVYGNNNWRSRLRESFEEAYRAEILYPTGYFMPKEGIITPVPEEITLKEYKYFDNKLRYEMHDPRKGDKENYTYELRTPKMKASLANYYDYIHSQDRLVRKQCIQDLRSEVKNAVRNFFRDKRLPDEKDIRDKESVRNQNLKAMELGLTGGPLNEITDFASDKIKQRAMEAAERKGTRIRHVSDRDKKSNNKSKSNGKTTPDSELVRTR